MIETQTPAAVTFPVKSPAVVVVNNALVQPRDAGITVQYNGKTLPEQILQKDSVQLSFFDFFASSLDESHYFRDVLMYNAPLRSDRDFLSTKKISPEKVREITEAVDADGLISIDRLLFDVTHEIHDIQDNAGVFTLVAGKVEMSAHIPGRELASATVDVIDTLRFRRYVEADSLLVFKHLPEHFLENEAHALAEKATKCFAPYWTPSERVLYTGMDSRMKSAYAYVQKNRWKEAVDIWKELYKNESGKKKKGMIAINIALSEEMRDRYSSALEWVDKALSLYALEHPFKVEEETEFAGKYRKRLEERAVQSTFLNRQLQVK
jgi:hypothetical protein